MQAGSYIARLYAYSDLYVEAWVSERSSEAAALRTAHLIINKAL